MTINIKNIRCLRSNFSETDICPDGDYTASFTVTAV